MRHSYLSTVDGDNYNKMTRNLIQHTMSKDFALQYSRNGKQGKNFSDTRLYAAVFGMYICTLLLIAVSYSDNAVTVLILKLS